MTPPDNSNASPVDVAIVGLRHPHATPGHEPVGWTDTLAHVPEVRVVAVCDPDAAGRAKAGELLPRVPVYSDIPTMLSRHEEIRAALVFLPNDEMGSALTELSAAGIHVALDKPGARTSADLVPAMKLVREKRLVSAVAFLWRMKPIVRDLRQLVQDGRLGQLSSIESRMIATSVAVRGAESPLFSRTASGGGILHWLGCHWLDLIRFVTDAEVRSVSAFTANVAGQAIDVEDYAVVTMETGDGTVANLVTGYLLPHGFHGDLALRGHGGWLDADLTNGRLATYVEKEAHPPTESAYGDPEGIHAYGGQAGIDFLRAFGRAVLAHGSSPEQPIDVPFATLDDAARVLTIIEAAYVSAERNRPVVPADLPRAS